MILRTLARRYARALFSLGEKEGKYKEYETELKGFISLLRKDKRLLSLVMEPLFPLKVRREILEDLGSKVKLSGPVLRLILLLLENDRIKYLEPVSEEYSKLCDEKDNILRGRIFSPYPLEDGLLKEMESILSEKFGKKVILEVREDKSLIAGLKLVLDGIVMDGTLKRQLEIMRETIMKE